MARHRSRRHRSRSRKMSGGGGATGFGESVYGSGDSQYSRVFGPAYPDVRSNNIIGTQGQGVSLVGVPSASQLANASGANSMSGGRRRRRGGFLGEVVNQAVVPFALLGMQQTYRRKRGGRRHTRRHRRH